MKYKRITIPMYNQVLHIAISDDIEKEIEELNKRFYTNIDSYDFSGYSASIRRHNLLILNNKEIKDNPTRIGTIAHEAFHISNFVCRRVGIIPDTDNDEAQAYMISWIVEQVIKLDEKGS